MSTPEISVSELARLLAAGSVSLVDVRNPDEYETAHVPAACLIPLAQVQDRLAEFPKDRPVHVICASGGRSARVADFLRAQGVDAINVAGGTYAWVDAGYEVATGAES